MTDSVTGEMYEWMYVLVLLPWEVMRRILCRLLHREMPSVSFHGFGYAAAVFFVRYGSCQCSRTTKCNANLFFFFLNTDFDCGIVLLVVLSLGLNLKKSIFFMISGTFYSLYACD